MKRCRRCGEGKDPSEFGSNRKMADGLSIYCRICARVIQQGWRSKNLEKSRHLARESKRREREVKGDEYVNARGRDWYARNRERQIVYKKTIASVEKQQAHSLITRHIKAGNIVRPDHCSQCGVACYPDGHHNDYSKPLEVEWLCKKCHRSRQGYVRRPRE